MTRPALQGVLFDLDGTLIDSLGDIADAANRTLAEAGFPVHGESAYRSFVGDGIRVLMERASGVGEARPDVVQSLVDRMLEIYGGLWNLRTRPYEGIPEVLAALRASGLRLAVVSNKSHRPAVAAVEGVFAPGLFEAVLGAGEGTPLKPDPAGALRAAEAIGCAPSLCALVGDSPVDVATARAAGMVAVGVSWGFRTEGELRAAGAAVVVKSPQALAAFFGLAQG